MENDGPDEYPLVPCPHCIDYPCRCLYDDDTSEPLGDYLEETEESSHQPTPIVTEVDEIECPF